MKSYRVLFIALAIVCALVFVPTAFSQTGPEPAGWYVGDMHVHRSCGGSPEAVSSMFSRMSPQKLAVESLLADMGNGEVQNPTTDLPLVNGKDDPISTATQLLHWDTEWHWDATYTQYAHQALGGHIVLLGLSNAKQIWQESTSPILDFAHQQNAIAGFAHLQYLDGTGLPSGLTCCTPIEFPVEVGLGSADFISEDVDDITMTNSGMFSESPVQAYYKLLNDGFRPGFAAGTDYPCNGEDVGLMITYAQVAGGQLTYRNWIDGISKGRTVVSRNGHNEFLNLTVNGTATPGDEIQMSNPGNVTVTVQWTATQNYTGTIELVQNGVVVASQAATAGPGNPQTLTATVNFAKSGWLAARRMANSQHYLHTSAVFVTVNNAPIRANAADAQFFVDWMTGLLQNTSPGGVWNSYYPTQLSFAQARYTNAKALFQQIQAEASGTGPTLTSIAVTPTNKAVGVGSTQSFTATGTYSNGTTLNLTGQARWASSNSAVATVNLRGLVLGTGLGSTTISASLGGVSGSSSFSVQTNPLTITTQSLSSGTVGTAYSASLAASGGTTPYTWTIIGSLPGGLSLNSSTGAISGTPTAAGIFNFTAQVADSSTPQDIATAPLSISIAGSGAVNCPCSIWPATTVPSLPDSGPDSSVELGVKFRTDVPGYITGIRFYKGAGNTGTHVGNLWNSSGTLLGTVTFTGETSSGWQQANFTTPIGVNANTTYVASYLAPIGHYADDQAGFVTGVDNPPLHGLAEGVDGNNGVFTYGSSSSFPSSGFNSSNYWVDVVFATSVGPDTTPPTVGTVSPLNGATNVALGTAVTATFSEAIDPTTINTNTFQLLDPSNNVLAGTVTFSNGVATLQPAAALSFTTTYTAVLRGGSNGVKDLAGNALKADFSWTFSTGGPPSDVGPGGPILVISTAANPFTRYLGEILSAEGLNEYLVTDISNVTASTLANYDLVILGDMSLTPSQVSILTTWVTGGGNLIAMHPDAQLAALLGITPTSTTLTNAYLLVKNSGPGQGIVGQTIQFHGPADQYSLSGASSLATLYSSASTATTFPAVTLATAGSGQAAAFTYDLARSIVYTRQGNPAWSGQARDGQAGPIRSDDLFFGAASFDPKPNWVDLNKVAIPQADEQQRLLANLILQMNASHKPLPRFWYLPKNFKAVVVMTGDDHGSFYGAGATANRFNDDLAASPAGCSVADWQCVRATAYLFPQAIATNSLTNTQAANYVAQGFEIGVHVDSNPTCSNWTTSALDTQYATLMASLASQFPSLAAPTTHRMHCIGWSDYDSQPLVERKHGIRLDTSYYYWPDVWINNVPGMFTGSGIPMRFTDRNGNLQDVYQATTQMTDESGQTYPDTINALLSNALGTTGYYGAFVVNAHNDQDSYPGIGPSILSSAKSQSVPIISSLQLLTWLDGRNSSSFGSLAWNTNTLSFTITQAAGARNLTAMLPTSAPSGTLSSLTLGGNPVSFTTQVVKGVSYAVFSATSGSYQAVYGGTATVALGSVSLNPASVTGGASSSGTVTLTGPAPTGGATVTLSSSNTAVAQVSAGSVTVPAGQTTTTFSVTTVAVTTSTPVTISGTYPTGTTRSATLTVTAPVTVTASSVSLNPSSVTGGSSSTGTVTLSGAAPTGGAVVTLTSSNTSAATVPTSVTVAAGSTSATFTVTTSTVSAISTASISATYGATVSATLTVNPAASVSGVSLSPTSVVGGANSTGTVTLSAAAPTGGVSVALSSSNTAAATVPASVTVPAGSTTATFTVTTLSVASNTTSVITATLGGSANTTLTVTAAALSTVTRSPTSVVGGTNSTGTVTLTGAAPAGGAIVTLSSSNTAAAQVPASVTVAAGATSTTFTITTSPVTANASVTISGTYGVTRTTTLTVTAATLSSITRSPTSVVGGNNSTGTATLNGPAPAGGAVVTLQLRYQGA
jgi:uncharacterized protein DUF4082/Big-like domain-containing protein